MSFSLGAVKVTANAGLESVTLDAPLGAKQSRGVKAVVSASGPDDFSAKLTVTDATVESLINKPSATPAGASLEVKKGDFATITYDVAKATSKIRLDQNATILDRDVKLAATWHQQGENNIDLEAVHAPSKAASVTLLYNLASQDASAKGKYVHGQTTVEPSAARGGKDGAVSWKLSVTHKLTDADKINAVVTSKNPSVPSLCYTHTDESGVELALSAPLSASIKADAALTLTRSFDL